MTKDEFYQSLESLDPAIWKIETSCIGTGLKRIPSWLRLAHGDKKFCPITAVYYSLTGAEHSNSWATEVGKRMGLDGYEVKAIIAAADNQGYREERLQLEKAVLHLMR